MEMCVRKAGLNALHLANHLQVGMVALRGKDHVNSSAGRDDRKYPCPLTVHMVSSLQYEDEIVS